MTRFSSRKLPGDERPDGMPTTCQPSPRTMQVGQEYVLKELLQSWGLPDEYHTQMSEEWKCVLAQQCQSGEEATLAFMKPQPLLAAQSCGQAVLDETGSNVFEYLVRPEWNEFPRPRFAMLGGWGAPGTPVTGEEHVALVHSFSEILDSPQPLNLQACSPNSRAPVATVGCDACLRCRFAAARISAARCSFTTGHIIEQFLFGCKEGIDDRSI